MSGLWTLYISENKSVSEIRSVFVHWWMTPLPVGMNTVRESIPFHFTPDREQIEFPKYSVTFGTRAEVQSLNTEKSEVLNYSGWNVQQQLTIVTVRFGIFL